MEALRTGYSHEISATVKYVGDEHTKAHPNKNGVTKRNLYTIGIGVRSNGVKNTINDFNLLNKKKRHNKVKTINIVLSPAPHEVNPNNPEQVRMFAQYAKQFVHEAYPNHLAYIAVQDDNTYKHIHCHCIISATSTIAPYRSLSHNQCDIYRIRRIANKVRQKFNKSQNILHFSGMTYRGEHTTNKHEFNRYDEINKRMKPVLDNLKQGKYSSISDFITQAKLQGVNVRPKYKRLAKRDSKGKIMYQRYKSGKKKGKIRYHKNKHGNYVKSKILGKTKLVGFAFQALPSSWNDDLNRKRYKSNKKFGYIRGFNMSKVNSDFRFQHINYCINHSTKLQFKSIQHKINSKPLPHHVSTPKSTAYIAPKYAEINNRASSANNPAQSASIDATIPREKYWLHNMPNYKPIIKNTIDRTTSHYNYNRVARSIPLIIQTTPCGYNTYGDEIFQAINYQTNANMQQVGILSKMRNWIKSQAVSAYAKIRKPMIKFAKRWVGTDEIENHITLHTANGDGIPSNNDLVVNTANLEPTITYHWYNKNHQVKKYNSIHTQFKHWVGSTLLQFSHNIDKWLLPQYEIIKKHKDKLNKAKSASASINSTLKARADIQENKQIQNTMNSISHEEDMNRKHLPNRHQHLSDDGPSLS